VKIPTGHFQRALGEPVVRDCVVHPPIDLDNVGRIAPDQQRPQHAIDHRPRGPHAFAAPPGRNSGFARALDPRIGQNPHQQIARHAVLPQRADHPPRRLDRDFNRISFNVRDFHAGRILYPPERL